MIKYKEKGKITAKERKGNLKTLYLLGFFLAVSTAFYTYTQSSFIKEAVGLQWVSFFFIAAMTVTLIAILFFPYLIVKLSNYRLILAILIIKFLTLLLLIATQSPYLIFLLFILLMVSSSLLWINLDVFLEGFSLNETTGKTRGRYFTFLNIGWLVSPIIIGYLVGDNNYYLAFLVSALVLLPILITLLIKRKKLSGRYEFKNHRIVQTIKHIFKNKNFRGIFAAAFLLRLFFTATTIYMPIYLNSYLGFSWPTIGIMFSFMLLPFVVLEIPAGIIADKYLGEKEILTAGFLILIASLFLFTFLKSTSVIVWALVLFLSRCGASLIEVMRETYFFKIVDVENIDFINLLRASRPSAYILGALLGMIIMAFYPLNYVFLILGIILIPGFYFVFGLKDTK